MQTNRSAKPFLTICVAAGMLFLCPELGHAQEVRGAAYSRPAAMESPAEISALSELIRGLQDQVRALNSQLGDLRMEQQRASAESRELRRELDLMKAQGAPAPSGPMNLFTAPPAKELAGQPAQATSSAAPDSKTPEGRIAKLEEDQLVLEEKVNDQYQTKVESGSKYRLRLSGIFWLNLFENRGTVDNADFPTLAETRQSMAPNSSPGTFGGSLRQSQIRLQAFGPDLGGARTSADINFDFAGGFADAPNGAAMGLVRLRTAVMRLDWANTSIVAGQDRLFFAPLAPTSLATLAVPALSYAGNLWAWKPQVRVEHRFVLSDLSSFSVQGGILDDLTGDLPPDD
jgi:hypothetical protein